MAPLAFRAFEERDVERAGDVLFVAFYRVALVHGLPTGGAAPAESRQYVRWLRELDPDGGIVAEDEGELVGVGWAHRRGPLATVGPIAVDPRVQGRGIGRGLLERCLEAIGPGVPQVRLAQESHDVVSLGLALRAGFRIVAPLLELELPPGTPLATAGTLPGVTLRAPTQEDRARVVARDARAFGAERTRIVELYFGRGRSLVAERARTVVGYALGIAFDGIAHVGSASADDPDVLVRLVATLAMELAGGDLAVRTVVPATDRRLVGGLLDLGFRVLRAAHYMVRGGGTAPPANYVLMGADLM